MVGRNLRNVGVLQRHQVGRSALPMSEVRPGPVRGLLHQVTTQGISDSNICSPTSARTFARVEPGDRDQRRHKVVVIVSADPLCPFPPARQTITGIRIRSTRICDKNTDALRQRRERGGRQRCGPVGSGGWLISRTIQGDYRGGRYPVRPNPTSAMSSLWLRPAANCLMTLTTCSPRLRVE